MNPYLMNGKINTHDVTVYHMCEEMGKEDKIFKFTSDDDGWFFDYGSESSVPLKNFCPFCGKRLE